MNMTFNTYYEQLVYEVNVLKRYSAESEFTAYLDTVLGRAATAPSLSGELRKELIKNFLVYGQRQRANGNPVSDRYMDYIYPGMGIPEVLEAKTAQPAQQAAPQQAVQPQPAQQAAPQQAVQTQPAQQAAPQQAVQPQPVQQTATQQVAPQIAAYAIPQPASYQETAKAQKTAAPKVKKPGAEFAIGGIVLSILGTILILTGFITLAMNFFDSFWQGMALYLVCAVILAFSELIVRRLVKKLSYVFSGLGIAGFFVVTVVNYFALELFNFWIAMGIILLLSVLTAVFARFKKAALFTIIGYASVFAELSLVGSIENPIQMYVLYGIMLFELALWMIIPADKQGAWFSYVTLAGNIVFLVSTLSWYGIQEESDATIFIVRNAVVAVNYILLAVGFTVSCKRFFAPAAFGESPKKRPGGIIALLEIGTAFHIVFHLVYLDAFKAFLNKNITNTFVILASLVAFGLCAFLLYKKDKMLSRALILSVLVFGLFSSMAFTVFIAGILGMFVFVLAVALLCIFTKEKLYRIMDIILKVLFAISCISNAASHEGDPSVYAAAVCLAVLIMIGSGFKVPSHIILTGTFIYVICSFAPYKLYLMLISGTVMLAVFAFHNVKWLKAKRILVFDIFAMVTICFVLGFLNHPFYKNDYITILLVFCFGLAVLVQYLLKSYGMFFAGNMMPVAAYLSYFVFVIRLKDAFITSGILMFVALVCVALGFLMKQKAVRIYGLVLAMFVCIKLAIFDIADAATLTKTIMYFVVGVLALIIAGVYIVMEMVLLKKSQAAEGQIAAAKPQQEPAQAETEPVIFSENVKEEQSPDISVQSDSNESV